MLMTQPSGAIICILSRVKSPGTRCTRNNSAPTMVQSSSCQNPSVFSQISASENPRRPRPPQRAQFQVVSPARDVFGESKAGTGGSRPILRYPAPCLPREQSQEVCRTGHDSPGLSLGRSGLAYLPPGSSCPVEGNTVQLISPDPANGDALQTTPSSHHSLDDVPSSSSDAPEPSSA